MLTLSEAEVAKLLTWESLIPAMEGALAAFSSGRVIQPLRNMMTIEEGKRYLGVMPAATEFRDGSEAGVLLPRKRWRQRSDLLRNDRFVRDRSRSASGRHGGRLITEMRTAAVSAAVTKLLAPPHSCKLALLGSGVQAKAHLEALRQIFAFDDVRVWSRTPAHARRFAEAHGAKAMDLEDAVRDADVVVTATNSLEPFLRGRWLKPGAHVNAVGSPRPTWRELDDEAMNNILIVDSREAALKESGDVILSNAPIFAEAGELFAGKKSPPRSATTVFKSVGIATEDIVTARLVYKEAIALQHDSRSS